jgi:hypothetical protein
MGVVIDFINLHDKKEQKLLNECVKANGVGLLFGFLSEKFKAHVKPLDTIADYFGEKMGFYSAWLVHYTSWLMVPSIIGIPIYLA